MRAFRIGKLFGIEIRIDWSWLFVVVLVTWNLASAFSSWHPTWPAVEGVAVALVAALSFFACILVHELAHSLVARRFDLRVSSITLFLFGGVSNIEHEPPSSRAEFFIAVAGPVASIALGIGFLVATAATTALSVPDASTVGVGYADFGPALTIVAWLGMINLVVGGFNLLPAYPLDGGRVLRSILWRATGNLRASTRRVSTMGQLFGWAFMATGVAMVLGVHVAFFGTGVVGGVWLAFIGWFLNGAAAQSYRRLAIDEALAGHTVREIMRRDGPTVAPELSLSSVVHDYFVPSDEHALAVTQGDRLVGLVSLTDLRAIPPAEWPTTPVSRVMRSQTSLAVASPDEPVGEAFEQLARQNVEQLPVLEHGHLVGMLRRRDIARRLELAWGPVRAAGGFFGN